MKQLPVFLALFFLFISANSTSAQSQQERIDSLVTMMRTAGREWNDYANPLIKIGEPAVAGLIKNAEDKSLSQWNRRISVMTLNQIDSKQWVAPALKILFDENEDSGLRNHVTAGLRGENLTSFKTKLWQLYQKTEGEFYKSNLASLLLTADTGYAYQAFRELYFSQTGHIKRYSLSNLVVLRPEESETWYLDALKCGDWMTANLAMDSLIHSDNLKSDNLILVYKQPRVSDEVQWRIVYILSHINNSDNVPFLVKVLQNENNWLARNEAAIGLTHFNNKLVLHELKSLKSDRSPFVKNNIKWIKKHLN